MAANNAPIFVGAPNFGGLGNAALTAANTAKDGTGTVLTIFTAGLNGSYLRTLILKPLGTNVATVLRLFLNNGSANSTATNNAMFKEIPLPAITLTETAAQSDFEYALTRAIPAGWKILAVIATAVAAGWVPTVEGGDF